MSGRCKSCDAVLFDDEMISKDEHGFYTEVCFHCKAEADMADLYLDQCYDNDFYKEGSRGQYTFGFGNE